MENEGEEREAKGRRGCIWSRQLRKVGFMMLLLDEAVKECVCIGMTFRHVEVIGDWLLM